jgi:hypothetical protein
MAEQHAPLGLISFLALLLVMQEGLRCCGIELPLEAGRAAAQHGKVRIELQQPVRRRQRDTGNLRQLALVHRADHVVHGKSKKSLKNKRFSLSATPADRGSNHPRG